MRTTVVAACLEGGCGNECGVQLKIWELLGHSCSHSTSKTTLFPSAALSLSLHREGRLFPAGRRKHWGKSMVFVYRTGKLRASSAAAWWDVKEWQGSDCVSQMQSPCSRQMLVQHLSISWSCRGQCLPQQ